MRPLPTIRDLRDMLSEIVDQGLGDAPAQIVVALASTLQAIARAGGHSDALGAAGLMVQFPGKGGRGPASIYTTDNLPVTS